MAFENKLEKMYKASGISKSIRTAVTPTTTKEGSDRVSSTKTPVKVGVTIPTFAPTPTKTGIDPRKITATPTKAGLDKSDVNKTPTKIGTSISAFAPTPRKTGLDKTDVTATPAKSTLEIVGSMAPTMDKTTQEPASIIQAASKEGYTPAYISHTPYKDSIIRMGISDTNEKIQHLNNLSSGYVGVGDEKFEFDQRLPAGGSSYSTHTRFAYNSQFSLPESKKGNFVDDGDVASLFYEKIGKNNFKSLREEAKRHNQMGKLWGNQPFIQRGIQHGEENPSGLLERINFLTAPVIDTVRIAKFMVSPRGLLFNLKQFGLQLTNPKGELGGIHPNRIYNPLALALQVPANILGIHMDRHFLGPLNTKDINYEGVNKTMNTDALYGTSNRLVQLGGELEVGLFKSPLTAAVPALKGLMAVYTKFTSFLNKLKGQDGKKINTLSGLMGPNSFFGIGSTNIYTSTSGIKRAPIFLYTPEDPYSSLKAANHYDDGKMSVASNGSEKDDYALEAFADNLTKPAGFSSVDWQTEEGEDKFEADIDPGGVNLGDFKTSTYEELADEIGNDAGDARYGNPDLASGDQSKFGEDGEEIPLAIRNTGEELPMTPPENSGEVEIGDATKTFDVFGYADIAAFSKAKKIFRDYRTKDDSDAYEGNSISRLTMPDYGNTPPGESEDDITVDADFVKIDIAGIRFRAYVEDIQDTFDISWTDTQYAGNPGKAYMFDKFGRAWSLKIKVPSFTSEELKHNYKNLNLLLKKAAPKIISGVAGGQFHKITVGHLWVDKDVIIDSIAPTYNLESWDIAFGEGRETSGLELPMHFDIQIGGKFLVNADGTIWSDQSDFFDPQVIG